MHGQSYCFRHNIESQSDAIEASSRGGKGNQQYHHLGKNLSVKTPADVKIIMEMAINSLWTGQMPASNPAGALGYLAKIFLEAHDKSVLELRVEALEKKIEGIHP